MAERFSPKWVLIVRIPHARPCEHGDGGMELALNELAMLLERTHDAHARAVLTDLLAKLAPNDAPDEDAGPQDFLLASLASALVTEDAESLFGPRRLARMLSLHRACADHVRLEVTWGW